MESRVIMNEVRSSADLAIVNECRLPTAGAIEFTLRHVSEDTHSWDFNLTFAASG